MSSQGGDFTDKLIREILPDATQEQIEAVLKIITDASAKIKVEAQWPSRVHIFRPGEYVVEGRAWEEYILGLMVPIRGPVDLWRQTVKRELRRGREE